MARTAKIACSIDKGLLARIEQLRARTGETRSALISRALIKLANDEKRAETVRQYVEAYRKDPETPADVRAIDAVNRRMFAQLAAELPWETE